MYQRSMALKVFVCLFVLVFFFFLSGSGVDEAEAPEQTFQNCCA